MNNIGITMNCSQPDKLWNAPSPQKYISVTTPRVFQRYGRNFAHPSPSQQKVKQTNQISWASRPQASPHPYFEPVILPGNRQNIRIIQIHIQIHMKHIIVGFRHILTITSCCAQPCRPGHMRTQHESVAETIVIGILYWFVYGFL